MGEAAGIASLMLMIEAKDHASEALNHVKESADGAGEHIGGMGGKLAGIGALATGGLAVAGAAMVGFAGEAINHTAEMGQSAYELGERMGITGTQASLLIGIGGQLGLSAEESTKAFTKMGKGMEAADQAQMAAAKSGKASNDVYSSMGIHLNDASGHMRSMNDVLGDVADRFQKMPDGPEKTATAMKLFGKAGADMIPMLNEGREGLAKMGDAAAANGAVLSNDAVKGAHDLFLAHKNLDQGMANLGTTVGVALMPIMTAFTDILSKYLVPALQGAVGWISGGVGAAFSALGKLLQPITDIFGNMIGDLKSGTSVFDAISNVVYDIARAFGMGNTGATGAMSGFGSVTHEAMAGVSGAVSGVTGVFSTFKDIVVTDVLPMAQQYLRNLWAVAQPILAGMVSVFRDDVIPIIASLVGYVKQWMPVIAGDIKAMWDKVQPVFTDLATIIREHVMPVFHDIADMVKNVLVPAIEAHVMPAIDKLSKKFTADILPVLVQFANFFTNNIMPVLHAVADFIIKYVVPVLVDILGHAFDLAISAIGIFISVFVGIIKGIAGTIEFLAKLPGQIVDFFKNLPTDMGRVIDAVIKFFTDLPGNLWNAVKDIGTFLWDKLKVAFAIVETGVETAVGGYVSFWTGLPGKLWDAIKTMGSWLWAQMQTAFDVVRVGFETWVGNEVTFWTGLPGKLWGAITGFGSWLWGQMSGEFEWIRSHLETWIGGAIQYFKNLPGNFVSGLANIGSTIWNFLGGELGTIKGNISGWIDGVVQFFKDLPGRMKDGLGDVAGTVGNVLKAPFKMMLDGVRAILHTLGGISFDIPGWVPVVGGKHFGLPDLSSIVPNLASGGIVMPQTGGTIVRLAEAGVPEAVIPLGGGMGSSQPIVVNLVVDGQVLAKIVTQHQGRMLRQQGYGLGAA